MATSDTDLGGWNPLLLLSQELTDRQSAEEANPVIVAAAAVSFLASLAFHLLFPILAPFIDTLRLPSLSDGHPVPLLPPLSVPGLPAVAMSVTRSSERPRLENHPRCGITTGGQVGLSIFLRFNHVVAVEYFMTRAQSSSRP